MWGEGNSTELLRAANIEQIAPTLRLFAKTSTGCSREKRQAEWETRKRIPLWCRCGGDQWALEESREALISSPLLKPTPQNPQTRQMPGVGLKDRTREQGLLPPLMQQRIFWTEGSSAAIFFHREKHTGDSKDAFKPSKPRVALKQGSRDGKEWS